MSVEAPTTTSLSVEHVAKTYPGRGQELTILRDIDLQLAGTEAVAITGPSGSGKSTLLHIIGGLDRPTSGKVLVNGRDLAAMADAELARFRNESVGFVFQDHHLLPQCTVLENVLIPTLAGPGATSAAEQRARELVERVGLTERIDHRPAELSGGERQRVAIARSLINRPALLVADEPTGNLDWRTAERVIGFLLDLPRQEGAILVVVTHSNDIARSMDRRFELHDGQLVAGS